jgi:nicotinate-nucleotide pyrophosphorylase (carboxylating)
MNGSLKDELIRAISIAFEEDKACEDITSQACIPSACHAAARLILKEPAKICGLIFLPLIFHQVDPEIEVHFHFSEGQDCEPYTPLATIHGKATYLLSGERSALNTIQHLSGIATITANYVKEVSGFSCDILDTRKTLPGLRNLQKYAVAIGGGKNHRFTLAERFLIKNNHLTLLKKQSPYPIFEAIQKARKFRPEIKVEVEVEDLESLSYALENQADFIMLDNMPVELVQEAVRLVNGRAYVEASGGITLSNVRQYAATGVNGISIGALTHSVKAIDISMRIEQ